KQHQVDQAVVGVDETPGIVTKPADQGVIHPDLDGSRLERVGYEIFRPQHPHAGAPCHLIAHARLATAATTRCSRSARASSGLMPLARPSFSIQTSTRF